MEVLPQTFLDKQNALSPEKMWRAVIHRNRQLDGAFIYAVRTTGIYCRPSCPARRPNRKNVLFFLTPEKAEHAGFRPCRRCRPHTPQTSTD